MLFDPFDKTRPKRRCEGCGGLVHMPCLACALAALGLRNVRLAEWAEPIRLGLELEGDTLARYLEIRAKHEARELAEREREARKGERGRAWIVRPKATPRKVEPAAV